jgi:hypothetical protein
LEELKLFTELFRRFNDRFDTLAAQLRALPRDDAHVIQRHATLRVYCDLCAEEYFYFMAGYIWPSVWDAWREGIREFASESGDTSFFRDTLGTGENYYGLTWEEIERRHPASPVALAAQPVRA